MITDETEKVMAAIDPLEGATEADMLGDPPAATPTETAPDFAGRLAEYANMNGNLIDQVIADAPNLAAISDIDRVRLFALLTDRKIPESLQDELRKVIDKQKKKKTNKAEAGPKVSERIAGDLAKWGYNLWLNDMDDSVWDGDHLLTDAQRATLRMRARDNGYAEQRLLTALDDAILALAASKRRHPLRDYLAGLTWDKVDHIAALSKFFTDNHDPIVYADGTSKRVFHAFLYRWLVGSVARIHGDHNAARDNKVFVLAAEQGKGKSHFAGYLCPQSEFLVERHINPDDKDTSLLRARAWVWEIGELGATTKRADVEMLKNHITATTVTERKAFGHFDTKKPCIASYVGTVNPDGAGFLVDTSGNRRFAVVELTAIDWAYSTTIDIHQVWAQAMAAWQADKRGYRFTEEEVAVQNVNADVHLEPDMYGDMLAQTFTIAKGSEAFDLKMSSTDMLKFLRKYAGLSHGREDQQGRALARSLAHHWSITGKRSHGTTTYPGVSLNAEYTHAEAVEKENRAKGDGAKGDDNAK